jgi:hypothetical protein
MQNAEVLGFERWRDIAFASRCFASGSHKIESELERLPRTYPANRQPASDDGSVPGG